MASHGKIKLSPNSNSIPPLPFLGDCGDFLVKQPSCQGTEKGEKSEQEKVRYPPFRYCTRLVLEAAIQVCCSSQWDCCSKGGDWLSGFTFQGASKVFLSNFAAFWFRSLHWVWVSVACRLHWLPSWDQRGKGGKFMNSQICPYLNLSF